MTSPDFLPVRSENIPGDLKALPQWVMWRGVPCDDGHISKKPCRLNGWPASTTNPDTWASFDAVCQKYASGQGQFSGAGFVFRAGGGITGIDFDKVIGENGDAPPWVLRTVKAFNSYTEVSVSGTGLHIFCKGVIPDGKGRKHEPIEIYDRGRYFTVSGHAYGESRPLRNAQSEIDRLLKWMRREEPKPQ
ncbi:MAG: hypothetical protein LBL05_09785, partial [Synergistaceae bacterium]|nr:hypothetical protein [Synergistaceae bacterium]